MTREQMLYELDLCLNAANSSIKEDLENTKLDKPSFYKGMLAGIELLAESIGLKEKDY